MGRKIQVSTTSGSRPQSNGWRKGKLPVDIEKYADNITALY
jgi:hypothetical protein